MMFQEKEPTTTSPLKSYPTALAAGLAAFAILALSFYPEPLLTLFTEIVKN